MTLTETLKIDKNMTSEFMKTDVFFNILKGFKMPFCFWNQYVIG